MNNYLKTTFYEYGQNIILDSSLSFDENEVFNDVNLYDLTHQWEIEDSKIDYECLTDNCNKIFILFYRYLHIIQPGSFMKINLIVKNPQSDISDNKLFLIKFTNNTANALNLIRTPLIIETIEVKKLSLLNNPMVFKANIDKSYDNLKWTIFSKTGVQYNSCTSSIIIQLNCKTNETNLLCNNTYFRSIIFDTLCMRYSKASNFDIYCDISVASTLLKYYYYSSKMNISTNISNNKVEDSWLDDTSTYEISSSYDVDNYILVNKTKSIEITSKNVTYDLSVKQDKTKMILACLNINQSNDKINLSCLYYVTNLTCLIGKDVLNNNASLVQENTDPQMIIKLQTNQTYLQFQPNEIINNSFKVFSLKLSYEVSNETNNIYFNFSNIIPFKGYCYTYSHLIIPFQTNINFKAVNLDSNQYPFSYRYYVNDINNISYYLNEGFISYNLYTLPNYFPNLMEVYLDVVDDQGLIGRQLCLTFTNISKLGISKLRLSDYVENQYDPYKILEICYYYSTYRTLTYEEIEIFYINFNSIITYLKESDNRILFLKNKYAILVKALLENKIVQIYSKRDNNLDIYIDFLQLIIDKVDNYIFSVDKIRIIYDYINELMITINKSYETNKIYSMIIANLKVKFNDKLIRYCSTDISFLYKGEDFEILMKSIPKENINLISLKEENKIKLGLKIKLLDDCDINSFFCINKFELKKLFNQNEQYEIIRLLIEKSNLKYLPSSNINNHSIISDSYYNLLINGIKNTTGDLEFKTIILEPFFNLKAQFSFDFDEDFIKSRLEDTVCLQANTDNDDSIITLSEYSLCDAWFYNKTIFCNCHKKGITLIIIDKKIARMSIELQFPSLDQSLGKV